MRRRFTEAAVCIIIGVTAALGFIYGIDHDHHLSPTIGRTAP